MTVPWSSVRKWGETGKFVPLSKPNFCVTWPLGYRGGHFFSPLLDAEELMLLNCGVGKDSWESLGLSRSSNQSILKEISPGCSLEGLMLKLKLQYFGHLMWTDYWKRPWCWERLKAGGEGDDRGWDGWMASPMRWTWIWASSGSWWWTGKPGVLQSMGLQRIKTLSDWNGLNCWMAVM